ncbi:glycosyltransferase [Actibacterium sp.]|uniref:glycosyltransferase n=1 Tax=Actibacterium sp. TaxID=1872125 RepID=UPI0035667624
MHDPSVLTLPRPYPAAPPDPAPRRPLGDILIETGAVTAADLEQALTIQRRRDLRLGDILLSLGMVDQDGLTRALARQYAALPVDAAHLRPDPRLVDEMGIATCLREGAVPLRRLGGATVIATCRPDQFDALRTRLPQGFGDAVMAIASERALHEAILATRDQRLAEQAETRLPEAEASRFWYEQRPRNLLAAGLILLLAATITAPGAVLFGLSALAVVTLFATTVLKASAALATRRAPPRPMPQDDDVMIARLPVVSVLVPLFREHDVVQRLIARLGRIDYPRELLEICLITEADDDQTRTMLAAADLPYWMRVITVPAGGLKTKPRAMNFALDFCRGSIIGIYDAEDAPDPHQIRDIVRLFHMRGPEVACLQGVLDFYNSETNWLSRCFTAEYASWFRIFLPGLDKLGLVVPLGGTTLFLRRAVLEEIGGWDAHNVTEDADLGVRLARHGYRTEVVHSVTQEEANCRLWPWVRQRSRWIKGFVVTWSVHMRDPVLLWRQLGPKRFIALQVLLIGSVVQALLVPLMWSFWLLAAGLPHPLTPMIGAPAMGLIAGVFLTAEAINFSVALAGVQRAGKLRLWPWLLTLYLYFPLAALAAYKALYEMVLRPFYWDKTQHGLTKDDPTQDDQVSLP